MQRISAVLSLLMICICSQASSQVLSNKNRLYTEADSLRGSLRAERAYEVLKYHLQVQVDPEEKYISGFNTISFRAEEDLPVMQIDLFENMKIDSIVHGNKTLNYNRRHNAIFAEFDKPVRSSEKDSVRVYYSGHPT